MPGGHSSDVPGRRHQTEVMVKAGETEERMARLLSLEGGPEDLGFVLDSLRNGSWRIRKAALDVLFQRYSPEQYVEELIGLLYIEDNAGARNTAMEALVRLGRRAVDHLAAAYRTENRDVRKFIVDILGMIGGRGVLPVLLQAIKDEDDNVRASAVEHIGRLRDPSVVDALLEIVDSGEFWTAYPALEALGRIGDRRAVPHLLRALERRRLTEPALKALSGFAVPDALDEIIPLLRDRRRSVQEEALRTIEGLYQNGVSGELISLKLRGLIGDEVSDLLLRHADHRDKDTRAAAMVLLCLIGDHRAMAPLLDLSEDDGFRERVKRSLLFIGGREPESLIAVAKTGSTLKRRLMAEVFSELGTPRLFGILLELLRDDDGHVIAHAARGLGRIGDRRAVDELLPLLGHPYPDVQEAAVSALTELGRFVPVHELIEALGAGDPRLRRNAARILGNIRAGEALEALALAAKDESEEVRKAALRAVAKMGTGAAVRCLRAALADESPRIRAVATESLALLSGREALGLVVLMAGDPDDGVRARAAHCLSRFDDAASLEALIRLLKDRNGLVVAKAIESLAAFSHRVEARDAVAGMLGSDDREIQRTAVMALASFRGTEGLIEPFLSDRDWATRLAAARALARRGSSRSRASLEDRYRIEEDPTVRKVIEGALGVSR